LSLEFCSKNKTAGPTPAVFRFDSHYIVLAVAVAQIAGGALIQFRRIAKTGAFVLAAAYLISVLLCLPQIVNAPQIYNS